MSLFPTLQKVTPNANLLLSYRFAGTTVEPPDSFAGGQVWRHITGTDTLTGFNPTMIGQLPFGCEPSGGGVTGSGGFAVYLLNSLDPIGFSPQDITGTDAIFPITPSTQAIRGIQANSLNMQCLDTGPAAAFKRQLWLMAMRNVNKAGILDMPEICIEYYVTLPDYSTLLSTTNRYTAMTEIKTGSNSGGDDRVVFGVMMSNGGQPYGGVWRDEDGVAPGTIGFYCHGDNNANYSPAITSEEYYRVKNFDVSVPVNEPFKVRLYRKRGLTYNERDTHRMRIEITKADGSHHVLFDIHKQSLADWSTQYPYQSPLGASPKGGWPARNIGMGLYSAIVQRIFIAGIYFGGDANKDITIKVSAVDIWDGYPGVLPPPAV